MLEGLAVAGFGTADTALGAVEGTAVAGLDTAAVEVLVGHKIEALPAVLGIVAVADHLQGAAVKAPVFRSRMRVAAPAEQVD